MNRTIKIPVDFGNRDEDGAVRLVTQGTIECLNSHDVTLAEGLRIVISDGELTAEGRCTQRDGMWVAVVERWAQ